MQALTQDSGKCAQLETNGRIDKVSEDRFANCLLAVEMRIDRFRVQRLSETDITLRWGVSCFSEIFSQSHSRLHRSIRLRLGLWFLVEGLPQLERRG